MRTKHPGLPRYSSRNTFSLVPPARPEATHSLDHFSCIAWRSSLSLCEDAVFSEAHIPDLIVLF
jgi:hypothetical protein